MFRKQDLPQKVDYKARGTYLVTLVIFEWCVVRCGSKNGHQKRQHVFTRILDYVLNFVHHSRLNCQNHN
jgi:hypothetical protein